ncbi:hypothetical protein H6503_00740 [Candidatus Woesearchaeota archaeon]|nr:hypothetical protein [Candidatus Woesearchaeota archaeon]
MRKIICFGEVLYDVYQDSKVLAGAPLNVASICSALGMDTFIVTAIPKNMEEELHRQLSIRGITPIFNYVKENIVEAKIELKKGVPNFSIDKKGSFDKIIIEKEIPKSDILYAGTLCQRSKISQESLHGIIDHNLEMLFVYDVNIRPGLEWEDIFRRTFIKAHVIKVNEHELELIRNIGIDLKKEAFRNKCKYLIVTKGEEGAELFTKDKNYSIGIKDTEVVDTTGCGDAFLSGFISKINNGAQSALEFASICAAAVAKHKGAFTKSIAEEIMNSKTPIKNQKD